MNASSGLLTSCVYPVNDNTDQLSNYEENSKKFNWKNIKFPVSLKDIDIFERWNPTYSVNVFGYEQKEFIYPLRISKNTDKDVINLFLISDGEKQHYCWIKTMSRLLSSQVCRNGHERYFCYNCLNSFKTEEVLRKHKEYCHNNEAVKIGLPKKEDLYIKFKNYERSMKVPFVIYADFECFTEEINTCQPNPQNSYTKRYQKHTPSGFCYLVKCFDDNIYKEKLVIYTKNSENDDVAQAFVEHLEKTVKDIYQKFKFLKEMIMTKTDKENYANAQRCHICEEPLDDDKVRDHCHLTGKFRGAAHNKCNLKYKVPKFIPVIFHNLSGYDSHLFIKNLAVSEEEISCIPNNEEKYISFTKEIVVDTFETEEEGKKKTNLVKRTLRFIDSFKFMPQSLDKLSSNLNRQQFKTLSKYFEGEKLHFLQQKGVYPYDYMNSLERFNETSLPSKEQFYSKLNDSEISEKDYQHAQRVWHTFNCITMKDYHDLYLKTDVLLLTDVFENFRDVCLQHYHLDPCWYYTAPGLAWDAALKKTKVSLQLLNDVDMLLMFEKGIRGGISTISKRYAKANNPYMNKDYNPKEPTKYVTYLDANNLYGWAMSKPLPTGRFKWMTEKELKDWKNHSCILEVDLKYPDHLHHLHNDYPLAPERMKVVKVEKLIPNLYDKTKYVVHCENLKLYEKLGLVITKIHRGIQFEESAWLKEYIDLNTKLRMKATNAFEKDFFKLMNNAVFGKTMENIRKRVDIRLVHSEKKAQKLVNKPNFEHLTIFDENLVAIHMKKTMLYHNKPVYLGMCILDLSKTLMYDFNYNYMKVKYNDKATLLFTDTDSLMYETETNDFYKDINPDVHDIFDTSNYPEDHPSGLSTGVNNKVLGMFKDEAGGKQITEFVGLRAKLYSFKIDDIGEKKCKGVKKTVVNKSLSFQDYKDCLCKQQSLLKKMNVIRSHLHIVYTEEVNKVALSADDDKRVIMDDNIHTLAYGHKQI